MQPQQVLLTACRNVNGGLPVSDSVLGYHASSGQVSWTLSDAVGLLKQLRSYGAVDHDDPSLRLNDTFRQLHLKLNDLNLSQLEKLREFTARFPKAFDANKVINLFPTSPLVYLDQIHDFVRPLADYVFLTVVSRCMTLSRNIWSYLVKA